MSCIELQVYSQLQPEQSQVVHTAWAILALISAGFHYRATKQLQAAATYLMSRQLPSGDWPQEHITGVFNRNCMITYANYRYMSGLFLGRQHAGPGISVDCSWIANITGSCKVPSCPALRIATGATPRCYLEACS